jgi:hypothetical protein
MTFKLDALFEAPDKRYLDSNDLNVLSQYVSSIPERVNVYRILRDQEVSIMQAVADALQQQTNQSEPLVERSVRNGLMVMRYAAMAMLLDDQTFVEERLRGWLPEIVKAYETQTLDRQLFQLLEQKLATVLTPPQLHLLKPVLQKAQAIMLDTRETVASPMTGVR